jgi:hypothetical protein
MVEKQKALAMHRNIQAGMRARTELVEGYKLAKSKEVKQLETMKAEITALDRTLFRMMFFLQVFPDAASPVLCFFLVAEMYLVSRCSVEKRFYFHHPVMCLHFTASRKRSRARPSCASHCCASARTAAPGETWTPVTSFAPATSSWTSWCMRCGAASCV